MNWPRMAAVLIQQFVSRSSRLLYSRKRQPLCIEKRIHSEYNWTRLLIEIAAACMFQVAVAEAADDFEVTDSLKVAEPSPMAAFVFTFLANVSQRLSRLSRSHSYRK